MKKPSEPDEGWDSLREKIIGLGEQSIRKSYYPELQQRLEDLARFKALLDQSHDAILLAEIPSGRIIDANVSACRQLDYPRDRLLTLSLCDVTAPSLVLGEDRAADNALTSDLVKSDGSRFPAEMTVRRVSFGRAAYNVIVARDITERRRNEEALRAADRRKDQFLAMLAHELRNPLSPMVTAIALIRTRLPSPPPELLRWLDIMDRQIRHMTRLVDDLVDTSRISRGLITLQIGAVPLAAVVDQAVEMNRPHIEAHHQELHVQLPGEPAILKGDSVRLVQILSNLLNNASKFSPNQGWLALSARTEGDQAVIEVSDRGQGIPQEILPYIFEVFFQADKSLDRPKGGLGLGLMLTKQLTLLHGGTIEAKSGGPNLGSTFTVRLPLMPKK